MRRSFLILVAVLAAVVPRVGDTGPITHDACDGTVEGPLVWQQLGNDVLENLLFSSDGSLWVSDGTASSVLRFVDPQGTMGDGLTDIPSPGGLAEGPDGLIHAGWGSSAANALTRSGDAKVVRFSPSDPDGTVEIYAEGLSMANGMTFGPGDDLYISNDFDRGPIVIPRADPASWHPFADVWGTNGLVIDPSGATMFAAVTFDQRSPIARIPLDDPASADHDLQLTFGVVSLEPNVHPDGADPSRPLVGLKGLDDMTRDADGVLHAVANGMGELLRVDPATGDACLIAGGLQNPSSVRIAPEDGAFADGDTTTLDLYVTEFSGAIKLIRFAP